ncbi:uncharacterized protein ACLA_051400 [Aspergillus clavatus NRRL 1]|uniref:Uncharacterized protein n=1 Tax=Aspergillus clavatus (strain ATCC 1007 / CBS 513.65 / DSM 816 / NCTC 3887 / NRRL 1 / QM 1276 / 107) TaxID=344612 RepID=A1CIG3_ASPCL|nr:uncharacterized protein ACLA_051400 [Aspergillus clavatus NRRL 1]EAW10668.1 hypothetical protein ACLA_051400 [Aspergillus clavatus NRRL 1]
MPPILRILVRSIRRATVICRLRLLPWLSEKCPSKSPEVNHSTEGDGFDHDTRDDSNQEWTAHGSIKLSYQKGRSLVSKFWSPNPDAIFLSISTMESGD